jgi:hypothetical protein
MSDFTSPHDVVDALYASLTTVDVPRLATLYLPQATLVRVGPPLTVHTFDSWSKGLPAFFSAHEELECSRTVESTRRVALIVSRFLIRERSTRATTHTGTNHFSLVFDGTRWWLASVTWAVDD